MMDIVTEGYLEEFVQNFSIGTKDKTRQFEYFANFIVVSNHFDANRFQLNDISTGENAPGIDGIAIIVNNRLCTSVEEVKDSIRYNNKLDVEFIFVQSKVSNHFEGTEIEGFFRWTKVFFEFETKSTFTREFNEFIRIAKEIYKNSKYFSKYQPKLKLFYVCNGKWTDDVNLNVIVEGNKEELENSNLFESVDFIPCDVKKVQKMYMKTKLPVEASITMENTIPLPKINDVKSAMFTILPFREFEKLIVDDNDKIKSVFEDNIRGFLGLKDNTVNQDIQKTITEGRTGEFCLLNNGVTIVAEEITGAGMDITLTNYQIVNGCQTSNVLYECRNEEGIEKVYIPVKIIETDNNKIQVEVTRATNNQTEVETEQLEALTEYQKELEQYYSAIAKKKEDALYYERRANQYKKDRINPSNIISIENQIKDFASMFNEKPHIVSGYYSKLLKGLGSEIFDPQHKPIMYYTSALAYSRLMKLYNEQIIDNKLWRFRYHIIMIVKYAINKKTVPQTNGKDIEKYCRSIIDVLEDDEKSKNIFLECQDFLFSLDEEIKISNRKSSEKRATTEVILREIGFRYLGMPKQNSFFK